MRYYILSALEAPSFRKNFPEQALEIVPVLLQDGTYTLPESVLPWVPEIVSKPLINAQDVPFIVDMGE